MAHDTTTINEAKLHRLPTYKLPPTYRLQRELGNACAGDPPGYPTYFTQSVYTQYGNSPRNGPDLLLFGHRLPDDHDKRKACLFSLWVPLPLSYPRTRIWINCTYAHLQHCYQDIQRLECGKGGVLIYPVPGHKFKAPTIDLHWTEECKAMIQAGADLFNKQEIDRAAAIAIPENHMAVICIRRFYPEYEPEINLINNPASVFQNDWWAREAVQPAPKNCPGHLGAKHGKYDDCRYCGRTGIKQARAVNKTI